ncbi:MAG: mucoidy inhibitor MuiA family protein [Candidatus Eisenbacteria bacterium]|nr:mucoidy inhibitor MuiA family protein [Candidatus Eisenbacteria bacterium]
MSRHTTDIVSRALPRVLLASLLAVCAVAGRVAPAAAEAGEEIELETEITSATIYSRQAQVVRTGSVELEEGLFSLVCDDLPEKFIESSLSVEGTGLTEARIIGIDLRRVEKARTDSPRYQELYEELEELKAERDRLDILLDAARRRKQLTESVSQFATTLTRERLAEGTFSTTQWADLLAFFEEQNVSTSRRVSELRDEKSEIGSRISWIADEIYRMQAGGGRGKEVVIDCESAGAGTLALELAYLVPDASWNPEYTLRYLEDEGEVELTYSARIGQATGEDWEEVPVVLSTAAPHVGAAPPELSPKLLGSVSGALTGRVTDATTGLPLGYANVTLLGTPYGGMSNADGVYILSEVPVGSYTARASFVGYEDETRRPVRISAGRVERSDFALRKMRIEAEEVVIEAERPMIETEDTATRRGDVVARPINTVSEALGTQPGVVSHEGEIHVRGGRASEVKMPPTVPHVEAQLAGSELSANLAIPKPVTLESGAEPRRSLVARRRLPGEFVLEAVPRLSDHVFVRGTLGNPLEFPILPGIAQVYVESVAEGSASRVSDYVGQDRLDPVASGEEFTIYLGVDQNVKIEREVEKQVLSDLRDKKRKVRYGYDITVRSFKRGPATVVVRDRVPRSAIEDVEVDDVEIEPEPDEHDEDGLLTWELTMEPGAERVLSVEYEVEHPASMSAQDLGLEE